MGALRRHQIVDNSLVLQASLQIVMVMFSVLFVCMFTRFLKTCHSHLGFIVLVNMEGGSGGPPGARVGLQLLIFVSLYMHN